MSATREWLEYRLRRIEFQNGAVLRFSRARMLYNEDEHTVALERLDMSGPDLDSLFETIGGTPDNPPEIKTIFYDMEPEGSTPLPFYHAIKPGADVVLLPRTPGGEILFIRQRNGRPMFSKGYTLRQVSGGKINSGKAVWQFHGYRHEG